MRIILPIFSIAVLLVFAALFVLWDAGMPPYDPILQPTPIVPLG